MDNNTATSIIRALGLDPTTMAPEMQQEVLGRVGTLVYQAVLIRVMEVLSDEDVAEFEKLIDGGADQDKIFDFLKVKVMNLDDLIKEEALKFKNETMSTMGTEQTL
jgi:hypothetical protein